MKFIKNWVDYARLPKLFEEHYTALHSFVTGPGAREKFYSAEELMKLVEIDINDERVVAHSKMMAVAFELEAQRSWCLHHWKSNDDKYEALLSAAREEREHWKREAERLTEQLRDLQLRTDRRKKKNEAD